MKRSFISVSATLLCFCISVLPKYGNAADIKASMRINSFNQSFATTLRNDIVIRSVQPYFNNASHSNSVFVLDDQAVYLPIHSSNKLTVSTDLELQCDEVSQHVPPHIASTVGLCLQHATGWSGTIRYPYLDNGLESSSNVALIGNRIGIDFSASYTSDRYCIGLSAENLLNQYWNITKLNIARQTTDATTSLGWSLYYPELPYALTASMSFNF